MTTFIILSNVLNRSKMTSEGRKNFLRLTEEEKILIGKKGANRMILGRIKLYYCKTISNSSQNRKQAFPEDASGDFNLVQVQFLNSFLRSVNHFLNDSVVCYFLTIWRALSTKWFLFLFEALFLHGDSRSPFRLRETTSLSALAVAHEIVLSSRWPTSFSLDPQHREFQLTLKPVQNILVHLCYPQANSFFRPALGQLRLTERLWKPLTSYFRKD